ncbi:helicase associated domain-containing protein [Streptomyces spiramyceticus]|uniref:helicase associated domain-containing protein n=1 Tax=Streptomyces spiramyceticus TaxID=299717 RepID=UPI00237B0BAE|nr:helicase associated domain-containing protein [Streptomyces spiramyceticus]
MPAKRAERLEALGMVWDAADAAFQENLAAARVYYAQHWSLCAPRTASALDRPLGQWLSNLRRPGALAGHPERAEALAAIDPDWNPDCPVDWQRHYAAARELLADEAALTELQPGVTVHGMDIGKWLQRQREHAVWQGLMPGQRERLDQLGVEPLPPEQEAPLKPSKAASGSFERGVAALAQYKVRTGSVTVPRGHVETLEDGTEVKLGVFLSNTKSRRAKLTTDILQALPPSDWTGQRSASSMGGRPGHRRPPSAAAVRVTGYTASWPLSLSVGGRVLGLLGPPVEFPPGSRVNARISVRSWSWAVATGSSAVAKSSTSITTPTTAKMVARNCWRSRCGVVGSADAARSS